MTHSAYDDSDREHRPETYRRRLHNLEHGPSGPYPDSDDELSPLPPSRRRPGPDPYHRHPRPQSYSYTEGLSSLRPPPPEQFYHRSHSYGTSRYDDDQISPLTRPPYQQPPIHAPTPNRPAFDRHSSSHTTLSSHSSQSSRGLSPSTSRRSSPHRHRSHSHSRHHGDDDLEEWEVEREMAHERKIMEDKKKKKEEKKHGKHHKKDDFDKLEIALGLGTFGLAVAAMAVGHSAPQIK